MWITEESKKIPCSPFQSINYFTFCTLPLLIMTIMCPFLLEHPHKITEIKEFISQYFLTEHYLYPLKGQLFAVLVPCITIWIYSSFWTNQEVGAWKPQQACALVWRKQPSGRVEVNLEKISGPFGNVKGGNHCKEEENTRAQPEDEWLRLQN